MKKILSQINSRGWFRVLCIFFIIWLVVFVFSLVPAFSATSQRSTGAGTSEEARIDRLYDDLEALRRQNEMLRKVFETVDLSKIQMETIENLNIAQNQLSQARGLASDKAQLSGSCEPSFEYEKLRRRLENNVQEFWYFLHSELNNAKQKSDSKRLDDVLDLGLQYKRMLLHDIHKLEEADGFAKWRHKESTALSDLVMDRLKRLQNPADCSKARKLVCNLNKGCGYGCQLHHVVYCFMVAYGTERTLVLKSRGWRYQRKGWEYVFKPVSETCTDDMGATKGNWPASPDVQVITLPIIDSVRPRPVFLPPAVPEDLAPRLSKVHGDPLVWWVGQFLKYLLRPNPTTDKMERDYAARIGFQRPIVGIHVRRTDKVGTEAQFHSVAEYMSQVEEYFLQLEVLSASPTPIQRSVYVASDDPGVFEEVRSKYSQYRVLGDSNVSQTASISTRYTDRSLNGIILDIHMLSQCDFLVCTFSSQVCRIAYEIMQAGGRVDASKAFSSLDDIYYYGGQNPRSRAVVLDHQPAREGEIALKKGDLVGVAGNHWNGYSKGRNLRTNEIGLFPSFKLEDRVDTAKFPTYPKVA